MAITPKGVAIAGNKEITPPKNKLKERMIIPPKTQRNL